MFVYILFDKVAGVLDLLVSEDDLDPVHSESIVIRQTTYKVDFAARYDQPEYDISIYVVYPK